MKINPERLSPEMMQALQVIAEKGVKNAAVGFSSLLGRKLIVTDPGVRLVPLDEIPSMLGGPEEEAVGIYLKVEGDVPGQMILIIPYQKATELAALMMEMPEGSVTSLGSIERSALGEMGNMAGTFFLNSMAELTGLSVRPSPPAVLVDMVGAILDILIATIGGLCQTVLMFQATFVYGERHASTDFWVVPDPTTLQQIAQKVIE